MKWWKQLPIVLFYQQSKVSESIFELNFSILFNCGKRIFPQNYVTTNIVGLMDSICLMDRKQCDLCILKEYSISSISPPRLNLGRVIYITLIAWFWPPHLFILSNLPNVFSIGSYRFCFSFVLIDDALLTIVFL